MNEWVARSIDLANAPGYLDKLQEVYPVSPEGKRLISPKTKDALRNVFDSGDDDELIRELLKLEKFPIKDSYVAYFRANRNSIQENPGTVKRIAGRIRTLSFEEMVAFIEEPKEANRQIGQQFRRWLPQMDYPVLSVEEFESYSQGIALLAGSDKSLQKFANQRLCLNLDKGPDILAKIDNTRYVLGEAKFITDFGGHQDRQFDDALGLLKGRAEEEHIKYIAILDGVIWLKKENTKLYNKLITLDKPAMSALLLRDYLKSLR